MNEHGDQQPEQPWRSWEAAPAEQPAQAWQAPAEQPAWQWSSEQPAPTWPEDPPAAAAWQPRRSPRSMLTRQWPTPMVAAVAGVVGAISMLTFHAALANANSDHTAPTSITAPQFGNGQFGNGQFGNGGQASGNGQQGNSGLTFPRWRFGNGDSSNDPFSGLQQDLQGLLQGQGRRSSGTNAAATAISPSIVDINVKLSNGEGAGTGIVLTPDGEILTNNHVIAGATSITATDVGNGKTYKAVVVGYSKADDVAVLQLQNASGLTAAKIASNPAKVGDAVVGVGNAEGVGGTPSWAAGKVTALNQSITATAEDGSSPEDVSGLMQTTAPIEPGDSGGPLVNAAGEVVGVDTAGEFSSLNSAASSAYAIPIAKAVSIADQIRRGDSSNGVHIGQTPMLGVMIRSDRMQGSGGVLIDDVAAGGPAEKAGLAGGDTITAVDGTSVSSPSALTNAILTHRVGETVSVTYYDVNGAKKTANVVLGSGPAQ